MESESKVIRRENYCSGKATNSVKSTESVSVDGRGLTMTPWKQSIFVLFILSWIDVSEEGCFDYFTSATEWNKSLIEPVDYVNLPNMIDSIRCTLKKNSQKYSDFKSLLHHCYKGQKPPSNTTCDGSTNHNISYYHFMCRMASSLNLPCDGCYPGDLCLIPSPPTTTIPPTTTPTTTPTATVPERTSTTPPTPPPTTPTVHTANSRAAHVSCVTPEKIHGIDKPTVSLLSISLMVNVVLLLLIIYLWMQQRRKQLIVEFLNVPISPQSELTTEAPVRNSTDTHSLLSGNDCPADKILP